MKSKINLALSILLPVQWVLVGWISKYPDQIEVYYSQGVYPKITVFLQSLYQWFPMSIGDLFYLALGIWSIILVYKCIKEWRTRLVSNLLRITALASCMYFVFHLFWALNYYRPPLYQQMKLEANYTTEELVSTTQKLIAHTNYLHSSLSDADSVPTSTHSKKDLRRLSANGYQLLLEKFYKSNRLPKSIKNSQFSLVLSYLGYGGYFNPFTGEAQVNAKVPETLYAVIAAHEQAHQLGYAAENEANFIGVLASMNNPDKFIQYSGASYSLRYCLNEVYHLDKETYSQLIKSINPGILAMYNEQQEFWKQYDSPIENISKNVWNKFLKANQQAAGIKSYNYMVALLVNYDKAQGNFL